MYKTQALEENLKEIAPYLEIQTYTEEMKDAAKNLQFERAAELRDMINKLKDE